ncbi:hypothetical protein TL16_g03292 [Triparma laevis f. inornata]|uniref:Uncharacterized protein n=2 Tax=Triparma laevis TaxID=1534972 RepID=A0A9W7DUX4_9STRA|nr:hypothetical protein TrLO_g5817 [Triparma laevis f. longispina]GMH61602.1 hypothetical protein TL16_g03292 [Triparma laevis f. inornata]
MIIYAALLAIPNNIPNIVIATIKTLPALLLCVNSFLRYHFTRGNNFLLFLSVAFIFHALGDFLLEIDNMFTFGLASFLVAHSCNLVAFSSKADESPDSWPICCQKLSSKSKRKLNSSLTPIQRDEDVKHNFLRPKLAIPFVIYYGAFMAILNTVGPGSAGDKLTSDPIMVACVAAYGAVLASCPWRCLVRYKHCFVAENQMIWMFVLLGYLTYAVSDSTLAIDRFSQQIPEPYRTIVVMTTYWGGQLLISLCCDVEFANASILNTFISREKMAVRHTTGSTDSDTLFPALTGGAGDSLLPPSTP